MRSQFCRRNYVVTIFVALGLTLLGCADVRPIYNVQDHPIPPAAQKLELAEIGKNIMLAGEPRHWVMGSVAPGQIDASYTNNTHEVHIRIVYSQKSYSIKFVSAVNMEEKGDEINHNYNRWIRTLEKDIEDRLNAAGVAHG
jgi:hypothetical protein